VTTDVTLDRDAGRALADWDRQQAVYIRDREVRFEVMLDALDVLLGTATEGMVVLDLACGPGSAIQRVLGRFPTAAGIALDADPVLLDIGRRALGDQNGRLRWVRADLRDPSWPDRIGTGRLDAVVSTTATHWLTATQLASTYKALANLLPPGGVLLNGDYFPLRSGTRLAAAAEAIDERRQAAATTDGALNWDDWWAARRADPATSRLAAERDRMFPADGRTHEVPGLSAHQAALRDAGFAEVAVLWHDLQEGLLAAVR
jgi:SAM-dependent methyltransferase